MTVAVVVPWNPGCPHREAMWEWVQARYADEHPTWEVVTGESRSEQFSRTQAILDGVAKTYADLLVIPDADVWCPVDDAVRWAREVGWAKPHRLIHRLSRDSTARMLDGEDWRGLPLSEDNRQDRKPYKGNETGTLVVMRRDVFDTAPPDPRFVGWGQEDEAWGLALRLLVGPPWRGGEDLVHGWHPPQERLSRVTGNRENVALLRRYQKARSRSAMRALIDEARCAA